MRICTDKSSNFGVIISALEVIEASFCIVVIATVAKRIQLSQAGMHRTSSWPKLHHQRTIVYRKQHIYISSYSFLFYNQILWFLTVYNPWEFPIHFSMQSPPFEQVCSTQHETFHNIFPSNVTKIVPKEANSTSFGTVCYIFGSQKMTRYSKEYIFFTNSVSAASRRCKDTWSICFS